jgi:hypothetical protein
VAGGGGCGRRTAIDELVDAVRPRGAFLAFAHGIRALEAVGFLRSCGDSR